MSPTSTAGFDGAGAGGGSVSFGGVGVPRNGGPRFRCRGEGERHVGDVDPPARQERLGHTEAGHRHPVRRARHRIDAEADQERSRGRVPGVFPAGPQLDGRLGRPGVATGVLQHGPHPFLVEHPERVGRQDAEFPVGGQQLRLHVVAAEGERHLGEVVGAEREEVGVFGQGTRGDGRPRGLDHGPHGDDVGAEFGVADLVEHARHPAAGNAELLGVDHQRDHDLHVGTQAPLVEDGRGPTQGLHLHLVDAGAHGGEAHAAGAEHGVRLVEAANGGQFGLLRAGEFASGLSGDQVVKVGEELVQGRIEQANGDRQRAHRRQQGLEVGLLGLF